MATPRIEVTAPEEHDVTALLISPIDEDHNILKGVFGEQGWTLYATDSLESASTVLQEKVTSIVITERDLSVGNWKDVLEVLDLLPDPPLLVVSSLYANEYLWAEALNLGVYDVLAKPLNKTEVIRVCNSARTRHRQLSLNSHQTRLTSGGSSATGKRIWPIKSAS